MILLVAVSWAATRRVALVPRGRAELHGSGPGAVQRDDRRRHRHDGRRYLPLDRDHGALHPRGQPHEPGTRAGAAHREPEHHGGLRPRRVLRLPLHRDQEPGPAELRPPLHGPGGMAGPAHGAHRDHQPSGPAAVPLPASVRQHDGRPHPARHHLLPDGPRRAHRVGAVGLAGGRRGRRHRRAHHDRLHGGLPVSAEDPRVVSPGVHLRDADDALHRRRARACRGPRGPRRPHTEEYL